MDPEKVKEIEEGDTVEANKIMKDIDEYTSVELVGTTENGLQKIVINIEGLCLTVKPSELEVIDRRDYS